MLSPGDLREHRSGVLTMQTQALDLIALDYSCAFAGSGFVTVWSGLWLINRICH